MKNSLPLSMLGVRGLLVMALGTAAFVLNARATSGTWQSSTTDNSWSTAGNWGVDTAPGAADTATFNGPSNNTTIAIDSGRSIGNIVFDTSSVANYTIGASGADSGNAL